MTVPGYFLLQHTETCFLNQVVYLLSLLFSAIFLHCFDLLKLKLSVLQWYMIFNMLQFSSYFLLNAKCQACQVTSFMLPINSLVVKSVLLII